MNPKNNLAPLLTAQLELYEPEMIYDPSLDVNNEKGLMAILKEIIDDIFKMSALIERIDATKGNSYENEILNNELILEMKNEIINGVNKVIDAANKFCTTFEPYYYLWLDERDGVLDIFLTYGRILTPEEMDRIGTDDDENPAPKPRAPTIKGFRQQIDHFENLFTEIEEIEPYKVFDCWFQVKWLSNTDFEFVHGIAP